MIELPAWSPLLEMAVPLAMPSPAVGSGWTPVKCHDAVTASR